MMDIECELLRRHSDVIRHICSKLYNASTFYTGISTYFTYFCSDNQVFHPKNKFIFWCYNGWQLKYFISVLHCKSTSRVDYFACRLRIPSVIFRFSVQGITIGTTTSVDVFYCRQLNSSQF